MGLDFIPIPEFVRKTLAPLSAAGRIATTKLDVESLKSLGKEELNHLHEVPIERILNPSSNPELNLWYDSYLNNHLDDSFEELDKEVKCHEALERSMSELLQFQGRIQRELSKLGTLDKKVLNRWKGFPF
ncbi:MAG: hypothetical protein HRT47_03550 [Candidatus Caenarcaniphilales bacterium]|nr:hypothetical protein [Candidatus Caenarcaniphilales bacterium]